MLSGPLIDIRGVRKDHGGLRPLRLESLTVGAREVVSLTGPDAAGAATLTDLLTGTTLPDAGEIVVAGRRTQDITDQEAWLAFLDQFGLVNDRVALLDALTVAQNLAVPLTLDLDPLAESIRSSVDRLAAELGLPAPALDRRLGEQGEEVRALVRVGRAAALSPRILILEHPTTRLDRATAGSLAAVVRRLADSRVFSALIVSSDEAFCRAAATRRLAWRAADGAVQEIRGWRRWLGG